MPLVTPTSLTDQQVREFQLLYWQHFKIKLTYEKAYEKGVRFLQFMTIVVENGEDIYEKEKSIEKTKRKID